MKIVHVGAFDCAAAATNLSAACSGIIECEAIMLKSTPVAPKVEREPGAEAALIRNADRIIFHAGIYDFATGNTAHTEALIKDDIYTQTLHGETLCSYFTPDKCSIWLNGSTSLRANVDEYRKRFDGFHIIGTTPNVCGLFDAAFQPCCIRADIDAGKHALHRNPKQHRPLIVHAPTDRAIKNTKEFLEVMVPRSDEWRWLILEGLTHQQCIDVKSGAVALFDLYDRGSFGVNAIEAWAMRQVVIGRMDGPCTQMIGDWCGSLPPIRQVHSADDLAYHIDNMLGMRWSIEKNGNDGRTWYENCFSNANKAVRFAAMMEAL